MEWISVDDYLPEDNQEVLAYRPDSTMDRTKIVIFRGGRFLGIHKVTHWSPLPEPPQD